LALVAHSNGCTHENIKKRLKSDMSSVRYEYRAIKKSGEMVHLELHGSLIRYRGEAAVIGTVIDISDRKKAEETVQYMAFHDSLTGLPNINFLIKKLNELFLAENPNKTTILIVELKSFKTISDSLGQEIGNSLILEANDRIKIILNNGNFISRWHEDKLVILLANTNHELISQIAQAILNVLSKPMGIFEVYVNPNIGISVYPDDGESTEKLLNKANSALYYAKQNGNNSFLFYTPDMNRKSRESLEIEMDLYKAIKNQELTVHYQPQFNLSTGRYIGNEALIRWNHPKLGLVSLRFNS